MRQDDAAQTMPGAAEGAVQSRLYLAVAILAFVAALVTALLIALDLVLNAGLCCADDAFFALIAKSLAFKGSYGLPISNAELSLFDPRVGSGPALIVPGALMMRVFGPTVWVPGLTTVLLFALQLAGVILILRRAFPLAGVFLFAGGTLALLVLVGGYHWYLGVFVGEAPTLGFMLLGVVLLAEEPRPFWAGLAFGLAFLTKQIALFAIAGAVAAWLALEYRGPARQVLSRLGQLVTGAALPVAAFEFYKLASLGFSGYVDHVQAVIAMTGGFALGRESSFPQRVARFVDIATNSYSVHGGVVAAAVVSLAVSIVFARTEGLRGRRGLRLALMMWVGGALLLLYVLLLSTVWERYFYVGVGMLCAAIAIPLLAARPLAAASLVAGLGFLIVTNDVVTRSVIARWPVSPTGEVSDIVRAINDTDLPLASHWWGEIYDVVYLLPEGRKWVTGERIAQLRGRPFLYVANMYSPANMPLTTAVRKACAEELSVGHHRLFRCGSDFRPD